MSAGEHQRTQPSPSRQVLAVGAVVSLGDSGESLHLRCRAGCVCLAECSSPTQRGGAPEEPGPSLDAGQRFLCPRWWHGAPSAERQRRHSWGHRLAGAPGGTPQMQLQ